MSEPINWLCPYCNHHAVLDEKSISVQQHDFDHGNKLGLLSLVTNVVCCPNPDCREFQIKAILHKGAMKYGMRGEFVDLQGELQNWCLLPDSEVQPFPDYIPRVILDDYQEACLIRDKSPKASATLSRRCLQGMIRNFWEVKAGSLSKEIEAIKDKVDPETWDAMDGLRKLGNIGAHMEADINLIVDVDPEEASLLISLIETLLKEWYVNREERRVRMAAIKTSAQKKTEDRDKGK